MITLAEQTKKLRSWKDAPNSKEALNTLPYLSIDDIDTKQNLFSTKVDDLDGITLLNHPLYTNKIAYINLYFDTTKIPQEQLPYLFLLTDVLGKVDTENYTYQELFNKLMSNVGQLTCYPTAYEDYNDYKNYYPKMVVSTYTLSDNVTSLFSLLDELMNRSEFDNIERLKQIMTEIKGNYEDDLNSNGLNIASGQLGSYFSQAMKYMNIRGLPYYEFIKQIQVELNNHPEVVIQNLQEVYALAFTKENLIIGVTIDPSEYARFKKSAIDFSTKLKASTSPTQAYLFPTSSTKQGIINGEKIQYIGKGYNFKDLGYEYSGKMQVLQTILSSEYLWNEVRVKGGAYGALVDISQTGSIGLISYRDPNLKETLSVFDQIPEFLDKFHPDQQEMTNYIIGTLKDYYPLLSPVQRGITGDTFYITGETEEDYKKEQEEILNTTPKDIQEYSKLLEDIMNQDNYCVVGNESKINENKDIFDEVMNVFGE